MSVPSSSAGIRRMSSRTYSLDVAPDLIARLPAQGGILWMRGGEGFVGWGEAARIEPGRGVGRFRRAAAAARSVLRDIETEGPGLGPIAFGAFTFDSDSPGSWVVVPSVLIGWSGGRSWLTMTGPDLPSVGSDLGEGSLLEQAAGLAGLNHKRVVGSPLVAVAAAGMDGSRPLFDAASDEAWLRAVSAARQRIRRGRLEKVVLARQVVVEAPAAFEPGTMARTLAALYPQCFTFACGGMVGATPELLVRRAGRSIDSMVLAGSAARGDSSADDNRLAQELLRSAKDRWEHHLAVRTARESLSPLCADLSVDLRPSLLRLANVQHLSTQITGELAAPLSAIELAGALHPGAAVCGAPTEPALRLIRELEGFDRGHYAAPVGWMDGSGDGEWALALRCAELSGTRARLFAGAGIVAESDLEAELEETRLKLRPILSALDQPR